MHDDNVDGTEKTTEYAATIIMHRERSSTSAATDTGSTDNCKKIKTDTNTGTTTDNRRRKSNANTKRGIDDGNYYPSEKFSQSAGQHYFGFNNKSNDYDG